MFGANPLALNDSFCPTSTVYLAALNEPINVYTAEFDGAAYTVAPALVAYAETRYDPAGSVPTVIQPKLVPVAYAPPDVSDAYPVPELIAVNSLSAENRVIAVLPAGKL